MNCILKELYCIFEDPLGKLKAELWFIIGDFNFPHRAVVLLPLESEVACTDLNGHCARKVHCWFLV